MTKKHVSDLTGMDNYELTELIKKATDELLARSFVDGFDTGVAHAHWFDREENFPYEDNVNPPTIDDLMRMGSEVESPQERRDSIIERAKDDLTLLIPDDRIFEGKYYEVNGMRICDVDFVVNKEKRTVVALMRGYETGKIYSKGIAKCAPGDCFNVHIGKAIALRRALGEEVPDEYLNAPQPTEVRVGDLVKNFGEVCEVVPETKGFNISDKKCWKSSTFVVSGTIIDDSREDK